MTTARRLVIFPLSLTLLRVGLAPVVVMLALFKPLPWAFGLCLTLAFVSDIFDGMIARKLGVATPALRRLDSVADSIFYAAALYAVWHLYPAVLLDHLASLIALAAIEALRYAFDFAKFRREASYHMWSSKLWGVLLFMSFFAVLAAGTEHGFVSATIYFGIAADIEGLAISLALPHWQNDVPSFMHALRIRRKASATTL